MNSRPILVITGAVSVALIGAVSHIAHGPALIVGLDRAARKVLQDAGAPLVTSSFRTPQGWLTRHPVLYGGHELSDAVRAAAAHRVADVSGVGGVAWAPFPRPTGSQVDQPTPGHCQQDVENVLAARSIRFAEGSAAIDPGSDEALDEVAAALKPCGGSVIAITGHTNAGGSEPDNIALSSARTQAIRSALIGRGIPGTVLRTRGYGSTKPLEGLDAADPANRRIEFKVISTTSLVPTPVDTPGAR